VQPSNVRTNTDRAVKLMAEKQGKGKAVFPSGSLTIAAGVTNAGTKSASVEPQQPIQRRFSLWAL
jgi:hypothetical protein